jgi:membrane-bound lytic murein transglycosylase B
MPDTTKGPNSAKRVPRRPRHAVPSLYAPSPRESVIAAGLAVALLGLLALVLAGAGGSAVAERAHRQAAVAAPAGVAAIVRAAQAAPGEGPAAYGGAAPTALSATSPAGARTAPTVLPGLGTGVGPASSFASSGIPATALAAYQQAVARQNLLTPGCRISWPLLAGIGRVESNHGRFAGAVLHTDGLSTPAVVGIPLNGNGTAVIRDTDRGRLDGDLVYDRAVGPMQFIPSTWETYKVDADNNGIADPQNIYDASLTAGIYLCHGARDLSKPDDWYSAILAYNAVEPYAEKVFQTANDYGQRSRG